MSTLYFMWAREESILLQRFQSQFLSQNPLEGTSGHNYRITVDWSAIPSNMSWWIFVRFTFGCRASRWRRLVFQHQMAILNAWKSLIDFCIANGSKRLNHLNNDNWFSGRKQNFLGTHSSFVSAIAKKSTKREALQDKDAQRRSTTASNQQVDTLTSGVCSKCRSLTAEAWATTGLSHPERFHSLLSAFWYENDCRTRVEIYYILLYARSSSIKPTTVPKWWTCT